MDWAEAYKRLVDFIDRYDKDRSFRFEGDLRDRFYRLEARVKKAVVYEAVGGLLKTAFEWVRYFKEAIEDIKELSGSKEVLLSRELKSFVENPYLHLTKKIMFYLHDALRNVISMDEFKEKAFAAVKTSLRTNMRTIYQDWIILNLLYLILKDGGMIVYPENKVISLERSRAQRIGWIPPNVVVKVKGSKYLSIFIEAPRPVGWEDSKDLRRIWKLYTALRPDIMVYSGRVMNIFQPDSDPPIKKPDLIIEVKELHDWYARIREVRGPFAKPLTVEEWRNMWIEGLWSGLAGILGVERKVEKEDGSERKVRRLRDVDIVKLYKALYQPKNLIVITRVRTPKTIKNILNEDGIVVFDSIKFNRDMLHPVKNLLYNYAGEAGELNIRITGALYRRIIDVSKRLNIEPEDLISKFIEYGLENYTSIIN